MNKSDLIQKLSSEAGFPLRKTEEVVDLVFRKMSDALAKRATISWLRHVKNEIKNVKKDVLRMRDWFPPADESYSKETDQTPCIGKAELLAQLSDKEAIADIDDCILELNELKRLLGDRGGFLKHRLVEANGIIKEAWVAAEGE